MTGKLTVTTSAKYIRDTYDEHITTDTLRAWLRSGRCPFGEYIRLVLTNAIPHRKAGKKYLINDKILENYLQSGAVCGNI